MAFQINTPRRQPPCQDRGVARPEAEVDVSAELVRALLAEQHPDLANLAIVEVASGWDNTVFRLGEELAVRLPRRAMGAVLAANEHQWLATLAGDLPLPVPAPVRVGKPALGYPWPWSVVPWFHGVEAAVADPADWVDAAERIGAFLAALHRPAPADAPPNPYRGVPLRDRSSLLFDGLDALGDHVDRPRIERAWTVLASTPGWGRPPVWLHGDLHPRNIVIHEGSLEAVIDFGDMTAGDPAVDLSVAWFWLPAAVRPAFRRAYGSADDDTWWRAKGWALALAIAHLGGDERVIPLGRHALEQVLTDER